jgi:ATP-dependent exoDNAse (exonuclease V) beta subunit
VNVLSSRALELIEQEPEQVKKKVLAKRCRYGDLKVIFVDEAQDLNETQYKII